MKDNPTEKDLKKFKLTLFLLPIIPSIILYYKNHTNIAYALTIICWLSFLIAVIGKIFYKKIDRLVYDFYKKLLKILGVFISSVALVFTWFCTILPTGIIAKLMKRDRLNLNKKEVKSYWKDIQESNEDTYENQY